MTTLLFATHNTHKVQELVPLIPPGIEVISLEDAGIHQEIPEPHDTLEANAEEKSRVILSVTGKDCFSEDTGLEVEALHGEPGVRSARFAGEKATHAENIDLLLSRLGTTQNRNAQFRTVISLQWKGQEYLFEGVCKGSILQERQGTKGFGYDPVFQPDGAAKSFAEMETAEKAQYSHRAKATKALVEFLHKQP